MRQRMDMKTETLERLVMACWVLAGLLSALSVVLAILHI